MSVFVYISWCDSTIEMILLFIFFPGLVLEYWKLQLMQKYADQNLSIDSLLASLNSCTCIGTHRINSIYWNIVIYISIMNECWWNLVAKHTWSSVTLKLMLTWNALVGCSAHISSTCPHIRILVYTILYLLSVTYVPLSLILLQWKVDTVFRFFTWRFTWMHGLTMELSRCFIL